MPVVPLPHPSGASSWPHVPANRARLDRALALVHAELERLCSRRYPAEVSAVPYRSTFVRLLGFLKPYRARPHRLDRPRRRLAGRADRARLGDRPRRDRQGARAPRLAPALGLGRRDRRARRRARGADGGPPPHLGPAGARRRDGHAQRPLRASRPPLVRLLRPPPDRPADVARLRRPPGRALLPRLRAHLLLPERAHGRVGDRRPLLLRVAARADRARGDAGARRPRVPLQPRHAPDAARRAAEARRRRDGRRGEHRRRPRREGVRAGARRAGEVPAPQRGRLRPDGAREPSACDVRPADLVRAAPRAGRRPARRRAHGLARLADAGRLRRVQPLSRHARDAAARARHVDRPGAARDRGRRAHLRGDRRARGDRRRAARPRRCRRATARSASSTSRSSISPTAPCSATSTSRSRRARRSR